MLDRCRLKQNFTAGTVDYYPYPVAAVKLLDKHLKGAFDQPQPVFPDELVQGSLQQWLGDLIQVDEVRLESEDSSLLVTVVYTVHRTGESQEAQFQRGI